MHAHTRVHQIFFNKAYFMYKESPFKKFEALLRKKSMVEHFCCGNTLPLHIKLEKLIKIFLVL